jgi:Ca-activated chloride channel family protein
MGKKQHANIDKSKMQIANRSIVEMIKHLKNEDRLGVVLFDDRAYSAKPLREIAKSNMKMIEKHILDLQERGGTNWSEGYAKGVELFSKVELNDRAYENRIIFITDAMPNSGELSQEGLFGMAKGAAQKGIYTTFIGVGVDLITIWWSMSPKPKEQTTSQSTPTKSLGRYWLLSLSIW